MGDKQNIPFIVAHHLEDMGIKFFWIF